MKRIVAILTVAMLGLMISCNKEQQNPNPNPDSGDMITVKTSLKATPMKIQLADPATKTASESGDLQVTYGADPNSKAEGSMELLEEYQIKNLWVIQFVSSSETSGTARSISVADEDRNDFGGYDISMNLSPSSDAGRLYVMANVPVGTITAKTYSQAQLDAIVMTADKTYDYKTKGLPMQGYYMGEIVEGFDIGEIQLERLVSKVIFKYTFDGSFTVLTPTQVMMRSVATKVYPGARILSEDMNAANLPINTVAGNFNDYEALLGNDLVKTLTWYVPVNLKGVNASIEYAEDRISANSPKSNPTYVELRGIANIAGIKEQVNYQFMLGNVDATSGGNMGSFNLERNTIYTINATIKGAGKINDSRISSSIIGADFSKTNEPGLGNAVIVAPGSYAEMNLTRIWEGNLDYPTFGVDEDYNALTTEVVWKDNNDLVVTPSLSNVAEYVTSTPIIGGENIVTKGVKNALKVVVGAGQSGNAIVAVKKGSDILWSWHVWVTNYNPDAGKQAAGATPGPNSKFGIAQTSEVHTYGAEFQLAHPNKVMMDRDLGAELAYYAKPSAAESRVGAWGMLYQFGRKDPFPRGDMASNNQASDWPTIPTFPADVLQAVAIDGTGGTTGTSLRYSIKNPSHFITSDSDWYTSVSGMNNANLWNTEAGNKGIYDPCPEGWRVPRINNRNGVTQSGVWGDFSAGTFSYNKSDIGNNVWSHGRLYTAGNVKVWYPASGYRNPQSSKLAGVGNGGYSWASSSSSTIENRADNMYFNVYTLAPTNEYYRARGFSVRCLQE